MSNRPKPIAIQEQNRRVHRSNAEKEARRNKELQLGTHENIAPPGYLKTKKLKDRWLEIASLLQSTHEMLCTDLDVDAIARYVMEEAEYIAAEKNLRDYRRRNKDCLNFDELKKIQTLKNSAFKTVTESARAIGLTVDARLRFDLKQPEEKKKNKFADL